jgi:hypothetical protein
MSWDRRHDPGYAEFYALGPIDSTMLTADGFYLRYFPEGRSSNCPAVFVTYKIARVNPSANSYSAVNSAIAGSTYDSNAGYETYHATLGTVS